MQRTASSVLLAAFFAVGVAHAAMYRWVDSNGRVHYSDTLPPTYQKSGAAEMNKQGTVIKRTQSEAERQAEAARQAELAHVRAEQAKQAQLDRALTQTYTTEAEIDLARDRALEYHKLAIKSAEARSEAVKATLADLRARIARIKENGRTPGDNVLAQLRQSERELEELQRTIQKNQEAMLTVRARYDADKQRFRELTGKP
ncbi:MAG: DUF4124 domain-containing protein [Thiobacillus sp.]|nr:DUF4124 domain-containing protein [Thiobacillus sp.]